MRPASRHRSPAARAERLKRLAACLFISLGLALLPLASRMQTELSFTTDQEGICCPQIIFNSGQCPPTPSHGWRREGKSF